VKNCSLWERPISEKLMKGCLLWVGPHARAGEECEDEGVAEMKCYELTVTSIPHSSVLLVGNDVEKLGVKLSPGRREGWGEGVF